MRSKPSNGAKAVLVAAFAVICCAAFPIAATVLSGVAVGSAAGIVAGIAVALAVAVAVVMFRVRRSRVSRSPFTEGRAR